MAKSDRGQITYEFEELRVIPDHEIYASGEALIDWEYDPDETDVGYLSGYAYTIEAIVVNYKNNERKGINLGGQYDPLYQWIEKALTRYREDSILNQIHQDHCTADEDY